MVSETSLTACRCPNDRDSPWVTMTGSRSAMASRSRGRAGDADEDGDAGVKLASGVVEAHPHAHDQGSALGSGEEIPGRELRAARDPLDVPGNGVRQGVDARLGAGADGDAADGGLWDEDVGVGVGRVR